LDGGGFAARGAGRVTSDHCLTRKRLRKTPLCDRAA
jgi:hypothetical protein